MGGLGFLNGFCAVVVVLLFVATTGGLGFLGSYAIEKYKKNNNKITIIDNLSTNTIEPNDPICDGCEVIIKDILDYKWNSNTCNTSFHFKLM